VDIRLTDDVESVVTLFTQMGKISNFLGSLRLRGMTTRTSRKMLMQFQFMVWSMLEIIEAPGQWWLKCGDNGRQEERTCTLSRFVVLDSGTDAAEACDARY
jgi:hypothetical protein